MKKRLSSRLSPRMIKNIVLTILILVVLITGAVYLTILFGPWNHSTGQSSIEVLIERGMTPKQIAARLHQQGIIPRESTFLFGAKLLGVTRKLQAGRYIFDEHMTNYKVLMKFVQGRVVTEKVMIPEGSRATRIAHLLSQRFQIDSTEFMALVHDTSFCRYLNIDAPTLEGYLYPDTYRFSHRPTTTEVLKTMVKQFHSIFADSLIQRAEEIRMSIQEIVTLASIVEGEAAVADERPVIAALYHNRLKRRMLVQADPTIQYIIPDGPRRLLYGDLEIDSPYNTYLHAGLPPGPVNNPGIASILAVLYPSSDNYLYMVANGDGSHTFSRTISEHLRAKARFDRIRRNVRRNR